MRVHQFQTEKSNHLRLFYYRLLPGDEPQLETWRAKQDKDVSITVETDFRKQPKLRKLLSTLPFQRIPPNTPLRVPTLWHLFGGWEVITAFKAFGKLHRCGIVIHEEYGPSDLFDIDTWVYMHDLWTRTYRDYIQRRLTMEGRKFGPRKRSVDLGMLGKLRQQGHSWSVVAAKLGVSRATLIRRMKGV